MQMRFNADGGAVVVFDPSEVRSFFDFIWEGEARFIKELAGSGPLSPYDPNPAETELREVKKQLDHERKQVKQLVRQVDFLLARNDELLQTYAKHLDKGDR